MTQFWGFGRAVTRGTGPTHMPKEGTLRSRVIHLALIAASFISVWRNVFKESAEGRKFENELLCLTMVRFK